MNQQAMMKKIMKMKEEMEATQLEIQNTEFKATVSGIVTVTVMGDRTLAKVDVEDDFQVESKDDIEMLTDMIIAACSQAYKDIDETTEKKMAKYQSLLGGFGF